MAYDENTCYWCGKDITDKKAYYSMPTDTVGSRRNFCCQKHIKEFKDHAKKNECGDLILPLYFGVADGRKN